MNEKKTVQFGVGLILIFCITFGIVGMWAIDIGASAMLLEKETGSASVSNGWWDRKPIKQYHMGLWLVGISMCVLAVLVLFGIVYIGDFKCD